MTSCDTKCYIDIPDDFELKETINKNNQDNEIKTNNCNEKQNKKQQINENKSFLHNFRNYSMLGKYKIATICSIIFIIIVLIIIFILVTCFKR